MSGRRTAKAVRRPGRRPGNQDTRQTILESARAAFSERGYEGATIRQIATAANVDAALVHHYFGTKERLFRSVISLPFDPDAVLPDIFAGGPDAVPERLVRTFVGVWSGPVTGPVMVGIIRSAVANTSAGRLVREFFLTHVVRLVLRNLGDLVDRREIPLRASLVASQLLGLALTRYVLEVEPLATLDDDAVVAAVAPTVRRYLFGDLGLPEPPPIG